MENKNKLKLFNFTMIVVGLVIGMGIFRTAATSAKYATNPTIFFAAWIIGGLIALCGALTYAEIGSRYPVTGGYYRIFAYAYHPSIAFSINCIILVSNAASLAGVALIGSGYISQALFHEPATDLVKALIAMSAIILFYGINLIGLQMSAKTQTVLMAIKIAIILVLISALFMPSVYNASPIVMAPVAGHDSWIDWIRSFGLCLIAVSFTYGGYQQTINFGNEVAKPAKNIPRAIFMGIAIIITLYLLVNLAYFKVIGFNELKGQNEIASVVISRIFGPMAGNVFGVLLFVCVLGYVNVVLLSSPRVMYAMSDDGVLPKIFAKTWGKREVFFISLSVFTAVSIVILFYAQTFDRILNFVIFLDCIGMAGSAATIFIIRKRTKHLNGTGIYSMKLFPLMPVIFIAAYIFVAASIAIQELNIAIIAVTVLIALIGVYFVVNLLNKK